MFHFLNHWIDGISTICYTFPERSGDYTMKMPTWIWYYGDFEIRQHLLVGTRRLEENLYRPAPWKLDDCWHNIRFRREYTLVEPEKFRVTIDGNGSVQINQQYFSAGNWLEAPSGKAVSYTHLFSRRPLNRINHRGDSIAQGVYHIVVQN